MTVADMKAKLDAFKKDWQHNANPFYRNYAVVAEFVKSLEEFFAGVPESAPSVDQEPVTPVEPEVQEEEPEDL